MLARYLRLMLVLEACAYVAVAWWLHFLFGWSYALIAALCVAAALAGRFAMVCVTTCIGHAARSPREPGQRIGLAAALALLVREWLANLAANVFRFPWEAVALRPDPVPTPGGAIPVVLLHGYFANRGYFAPLARGLEARGIAPVFAPNLPAVFATIDDYAEALHAEIERIAGGTGHAQVILVAHSMGGLGARAYLCAHGTARVRRLVTIASPHNGTVHARFGAGENAKQMRRGSAFLAALAGREGERGPGCHVTSVYTIHDNLVAPQETSRLAWARNRVVAGRGHVEILGSAELLEILAAEIRECVGPSG